MAESVLDPGVLQALNTGLAKEAGAAADTRTRAWDMIAMAVGTAQTNYVSAPSVMAAQGIRMLNGTPGNVPHATAGSGGN